MKGGLNGLGEFKLIATLTGRLKQAENVRQGIGDDCAIISSGDRLQLLTCDASLEDVHFKRGWGRPRDVGRKAAVSALSDIAAMGGRADSALVTIALPEDAELAYVEALYEGLADAVEAAGATIVGGDTTASRSGIVIDMMVTGEIVGRPVLRSGAVAGNVIAVTGRIGERGAGLHALLNDIDAPELIDAYFQPVPRLDEGQWLQAHPGVRAMMDVSDGLLPDARHLARAGKVKIDLQSDLLPQNLTLEAYWQACKRKCAAERFRSGEEYELLVVMAKPAAATLCDAFENHFNLPLTVIGRCTAGAGKVTIDGKTAARRGFEHFTLPDHRT